MKYAIIIPDGCCDEPQSELDGRTPLEVARTPAMDQIAMEGKVGRANHTPAQFDAGSDVANLSLFGYDPIQHFTGRAALEAAGQGILMGKNDWAIRCNLVTVQDQVMQDFTAGHITSAEAKQLVQLAQRQSGSEMLEFVAGVSYRNLILCRASKSFGPPFTSETRTTPPHDLTGKSISDDFPRGPGSEILATLMNRSVDWFARHEVNQRRIEQGLLPATNLWLWGLGRQPRLNSFREQFGVQGAMITAVDLLRGLAALIGWNRIEVPGATGYVDTDYASKGNHAVQALANHDLVCVHIEATDEASHQGDLAMKIEALERIDELIVAPLLRRLRQEPGWRIMVTPDHPTLLRTKTHAHGDVPFCLCGTGIETDGSAGFHEKAANQSNIVFDPGYELMRFFIRPC